MKNRYAFILLTVLLLCILVLTVGCQDTRKQTAPEKDTQEKKIETQPSPTETPEAKRKNRILYFADLIERKRVIINADFEEYLKKRLRKEPGLLNYNIFYHGKKKSIQQHPPEENIPNTVSFEGIPIEQQTMLKFSTGIFIENPEQAVSEDVTFTILLQDQAEQHVLFEEVVNTHDEWTDHILDLSAYAGTTVTLAFTTKSSKQAESDRATWGSPRLTYHLLEEESATKEIGSAKRYESVLNTYQGIVLKAPENRVDRGWFADATTTDLRLHDVRVNTVIRTELFVLERSANTQEEVIIELLDETGQVIGSSTYAITEEHQVISDEQMVKEQQDIPITLRIRLDQENPSIVFIKEPIQYALRPADNPQSKPNVILISLDTLRPDHLGCYGYARDTSAAIDALAQESFIFTNSYSNSNATLPSHASMLNSLYPVQHQISLQRRDIPYDSPYYYIPEAFKAEKYVTIAFTGGGFVHSRYGFNKGFDYHVEDVQELDPSRLDILLTLTKTNRDAPLFIFFHTYEIHDYFYDKPVYQKYVQNEFQKDDDVSWLDLIFFMTVEDVDSSRINQSLDKFKNKALPKAGRDHLVDLYDGALWYTDSLLGKFFQELQTLGLYENSWIIVTSDHGEGFGEVHNNKRTTSWYHGFRLYNDQIKVPLLIKPPKNSNQPEDNNRIIPQFVQGVDLAPTMLSMLGIKPHEQFQGKDLIPFMTTPESVANEGIGFSENTRQKNFSMITDKYKLIMTPRSNMLIHENQYTYQLYDLVEDAAERENLLARRNAAKYAPMYNEFKEILWEHIGDLLNKTCAGTVSAEDTESEPGEIDEEHLQRLRDLGYL